MVSTYPSEKSWSESQLGWWHSQYMEKLKCSKPPTSICWFLVSDYIPIRWLLRVNHQPFPARTLPPFSLVTIPIEASVDRDRDFSPHFDIRWGQEIYWNAKVKIFPLHSIMIYDTHLEASACTRARSKRDLEKQQKWVRDPWRPVAIVLVLNHP